MKYFLSLMLFINLSCISLIVAAKTEPAAGNQAVFLNTKPSSALLPFSEAVRVGHTLYLSGQIGIDPVTNTLATGGVKAQAKQTLENIKRTLNNYGYRMEQVVKCMAILTDINDFKAFNQVYTQYFTPPYPARSAFAASQLALGASVEIECIAVVNHKQ